jgi:hypothetical protein
LSAKSNLPSRPHPPSLILILRALAVRSETTHPLLILSGWLDTSTSPVLLCPEPPDGLSFISSALRVPFAPQTSPRNPCHLSRGHGPRMITPGARLLLKDKRRTSGSLRLEVDSHVDAVADVDEGNAFIHPVVLTVEDHGPFNLALACRPRAGNG